jgi:predicted phosphodiesterase
MKKTELAKQYRQQYGGEMPSLKLARIMYKENKLLFKDVEDCRKFLRYIEGKHKNLKNGSSSYEKTPDRPRNPYQLPETEEKQWLPFHINAKRVLILSDIHVPYHNIDAITAAFDFAKDEKIDAILLNGDTIDFFGISRFMKDPRARSVAFELEAFRQLFEVLHKTFGCKIYYKLGNHCERYQHFLWMKAGELEGVDEFKFENIIKARAEGIEVISDKRIIKLGTLNVLHGHEFGGSIFSPVNIARGLFLRGKVSAMQGHNHQTSEHTESNMNGDITTTWSVGCLCELHPTYLPINKWNHGFAIVDVDGDNFFVRNKRIHNGKVL